MDKIITYNNLKYYDEQIKSYLTSNLQIISRTITSDSEGKIVPEEIEGYQILNILSFDNGLPLNCIRFGDYYYVGYYGGSSTPNATSAVTVLFTTKANQECQIVYIKN